MSRVHSSGVRRYDTSMMSIDASSMSVPASWPVVMVVLVVVYVGEAHPCISISDREGWSGALASESNSSGRKGCATEPCRLV